MTVFLLRRTVHEEVPVFDAILRAMELRVTIGEVTFGIDGRQVAAMLRKCAGGGTRDMAATGLPPATTGPPQDADI
jgi:hypothetical protein